VHTPQNDFPIFNQFSLINAMLRDGCLDLGAKSNDAEMVRLGNIVLSSQLLDKATQQLWEIAIVFMHQEPTLTS